MSAPRLVTLLILGLVAVPAGVAASLESIRGTLDHVQANLVGETQFSAQKLGAAFLRSDGRTSLVGTFSLEGAHVVVHRTFISKVVVGPSDDLLVWGHETSNGSAQAEYSRFTIAGTVKQPGSGVLIKPSPDATMSLAGEAGSFLVGPAQRETWMIGRTNSKTVNATFPQTDPMDRFFTTTPGQPWCRISEPIRLVVAGNFTLHLWGPAFGVAEVGGTESAYRSGRWDENQTGATRDRHEQLVELRVTNGTLAWEHREGFAQLVASDAYVQTHGTVFLVGATGVLASTKGVYEFHGEAARLVGTVSQRLDAHKNPDLLTSVILPSQAEVTGTISPQVPAKAGLNLTPWLLASAAIVGGLVVLFVRAHNRIDWQDELERANRDFWNHRYGGAARRAKRVLRRAPLHEHAWFLYAAGLMAARPGDRKATKRVIDTLKPQMERMGGPAMLAFLLSLAHQRNGDRQAALRWFDIALANPEFASHAAVDPAVRALRKELAKDAAEVAYG